MGMHDHSLMNVVRYTGAEHLSWDLGNDPRAHVVLINTVLLPSPHTCASPESFPAVWSRSQIAAMNIDTRTKEGFLMHRVGSCLPTNSA